VRLTRPVTAIVMSHLAFRIAIPLGWIGLLLSWTAAADTCKHVDKDGRTIYSNVPLKNARKVSCVQLPPPVSPETPPQENPGHATRAPAPGDGKPSRVPMSAQHQDYTRQTKEEALDRERMPLAEAKRALAQQMRMPAGGDADAEHRLKRYRDPAALHEKNVKSLGEELANLR